MEILLVFLKTGSYFPCPKFKFIEFRVISWINSVITSVVDDDLL